MKKKCKKNNKAEKELKNRFIGMVSAAILTLGSFLVYSYFGSFETKAAAETKYSNLEKINTKRYNKLDKNMSIMLCYMNKKHCLPLTKH